MPAPARDQLAYLLDAFNAAGKVMRYLDRHATEESFLKSEQDQDGAGMQMIVLGNAVHSLSAATLTAAPLPDPDNWQWEWCYRTRGALAHNYEGMDLGRFWREARERLPIIIAVLSTYLQEVAPTLDSDLDGDESKDQSPPRRKR